MDSDSSKTRFLTAIGHDMRQPLHALLLYLSALERRVEDGEAREVLARRLLTIGSSVANRTTERLAELRIRRREVALGFVAQPEVEERPRRWIESIALGELRTRGGEIARLHLRATVVEERLREDLLLRSGICMRDSRGRAGQERDDRETSKPHKHPFTH